MNTQNLCFARVRMMTLASALALGGILAMSPVFAATPATASSSVDALAPQTAGGVSYLNGGVGADEQAQMRADAHQWPLRIEFSEGKSGAFVADAQLKVTRAGKTVFDIDNAGPMTYVKLSPGEYRVTASHNGKTLTRDAHVTAKGVNVFFHW